jgi:hypothetical protein
MAPAADRDREARAREEHAAVVALWDAEAAWRKQQSVDNVPKWAAIRKARGAAK